MQVSEARIAANRANAQKSTGPKDTSKTRFNGVQHGLTAMHTLLPWEHKEDLQAILDSFESRYQPVDDVERLLVKQVAVAYWRMERSLRIEKNILETVARGQAEDADLAFSQMHAGNLEAIAFMVAAENMDRFRRYDAHLQRAFERALKRVEQMASLRKPDAQPLPPPEPIERPVNKTQKLCIAHPPFNRKTPIRALGELLNSTPPHSGDGSMNKPASTSEGPTAIQP